MNLPKIVPAKAEQLQLPHLDSLTFVLVFVQSFRGLSDFSDFLGELRPRWIFDIRSVPRMDVLGGARSHVFSVFQKYDINYVDLLGQLGITSEQDDEAKPSRWGKKVAKVVEESKKPGSAVLLLFDNLELLNTSAQALPRALQSAMNRPVAISTYV